MADQNTPLKHIKIVGNSQTGEYKSPRTARQKPPKSRDRVAHGNKLYGELNEIKTKFEVDQLMGVSDGLIQEDAVYVEFISDFDVELAFDSFNSEYASPKYQLLSIKLERVENEIRYRVNVMLKEGGISHFLSRINDYLTSTSTKPKHEKLISNIESIQLATLQAFWQEPLENEFPNENEEVWWEVWFRKTKGTVIETLKEKVENQLTTIEAEVSQKELVFPEHYIRLVKATPQQLSSSLLLLDNLAELRKPKDTADFFTNLTISEREEWIDDIKSRTVNQTDEDSIVICLLDSGVQNQHPLLLDYIPNENLFSYKPEDWGTFDGVRNGGHGTGMAGLALYGDLTNALATSENIEIFHRLESVKIINSSDPTDPELYGAVTVESTNSPIASFPDRIRVYCMAISSAEKAYRGRPSSWSAAVDKIAYGDAEANLDPQLFLLSGGNIEIESPDDYGVKNITESVHDPAQAFNAISVGAYTEMDEFDAAEFPNSEVLAEKGGMAPANSTSIIWENNWAVKPDLVLEGGNLINQEGNVVKLDSLQLLTTHKEIRVHQLQTFGDTSAATALASKFAANLKTLYPDLWPETIRALMVHSSDWNSVMLNNRTLIEFGSLGQQDKKNVLRCFGYGVPSLSKAMYSASNSLTLIAEKEITPYKKDGDIKFDEIHYFDLPWPEEVLRNDLTEVDLKLNITLSYFIEPNPGNRQYANKFNYQSHGLRFSVIKPGEDFEEFEKRTNKNAREEGVSASYSGEEWIIGTQLRDKGSIHRDFCVTTGANLSTRNKIAVYPVNGWYRTRKKLEKYNTKVRYSLIVSIESPIEGIDIYTPVLNQIPIEI